LITSAVAVLEGCAIAHLACHGDTNPTDPSQSLLLLHDHDTDPLTIGALAPIQLDKARLAYLSACSTAFNPSVELIDKVIHLTSAFQLAGYPHVIGTFWEIDDKLAADMACGVPKVGHMLRPGYLCRSLVGLQGQTERVQKLWSAI